MTGAGGALFRIIAAGPARILASTVCPLTVRGARHLPREGAALLVCNHQGYLDPFFLQLAAIRWVRYLMTSDFYDLPAARPFFRMIQAIRIPKSGVSRDAFRQAFRVLEDGDLVGIFPEGRLSHDGGFGKLQPGAAVLAARSGVPVIPARIRGSIRVLPKGHWFPRPARVLLRFGAPMRLSANRRRATEEILGAWEAL